METPVREPESGEVKSIQDVAELHLLLGEMEDELTGYRRREAVWLSIVVHVLGFLALIFVPKLIPKSAVVVPVTPADKDLTFMALPPDKLRVKPPKTDIASDKNRVAQSPHPLDKDALRKILDANRAGAHKPPTPPPQPSQQAMQAPPQEANTQQQQTGAQAAPQPTPTQAAQLHTPPAGGNPFKTTAPGIQHAIDALGASHGATHYTFSAGGDYGTNRAPNTTMRGDVEITSDTQGVDFGPYLQRVLYVIRTHWYQLVPEVARPPIMKNGSLIIAFAILKDGKVAGMNMERSSDDVSLDRAAWGGITDSNPFDRLPSAFPGEYLGLRIKFIYNPNAKDLQ